MSIDAHFVIPVAASVPASDYTGLVYVLAVIHAVVTAAALVASWVAAQSVKRPALRSFVRFVPLAVSLSFSPLHDSENWVPATWALLLAPLEDKAYALGAIVAAVLALFVLCELVHRVVRSGTSSTARPPR